MGIFDCFLIRRFLADDDAARVQDEQSPASSVEYPPPTAGHQAQAAGPRLQESLDNDVSERPDRENHSRASTASDGYSSDHSQPQDQRSSPIGGINITYNESNCGSNTDDDEEGEWFRQGSAWKVRARYRRRSLSSSSSASTLPIPLILLPPEDMAVIGALFHHPEVYPAPRETEWRDFTRTMTRLQFSMRPNRRGGALRRFEVMAGNSFIPAGSEGEVITAHEPHAGRTTLDLVQMREIGRRLTNAFGWSADTFHRR